MAEEWHEADLGELATLTIGRTPQRGNPDYWTTDLTRPFCTIADMPSDGGTFSPSREGVTELAEAHDKAKRAPAGSLLMSFKLTIGRVAFPKVDVFPNEAIVHIEPHSDGPVTKAYLALWLGSRDLTAGSGRAVKGNTLNGKSLRAISVRYPPLSVQRRIVDLMEHLDKQVDNLHREVQSASCVAGQLRRSVFDELLASGRSVRADVMFEMLLGRQKSARQSVGDHVYPYVRAANIGEQGWRLEDIQTMNFEPHEQVKYGIEQGDILLVEGGSVGVAQRWEGGIEGFVGFDKHVIRLRAKPGISTSEYALQWCKWSRESGAFEEQATGITIRALGFARASAMAVPDVDTATQESTVDVLADADATVHRLREEASTTGALRSALLSGLLSGEKTIPESYDDLLGEVS